MECGGKRSATPLWEAHERRAPKKRRRRSPHEILRAEKVRAILPAYLTGQALPAHL